jgi:hypothetical protein
MAQGIVLGLMLATLAIIIVLGRKLWANQSEGARRLKLVIKIGSALLVGAIILNAGNDGPFLAGIAVVLGVGYWVVKGFKKG